MQDFKIAHQHTQKPTTPKGGDHHACQMLATTIHKSNTTPHHQKNTPHTCVNEGADKKIELRRQQRQGNARTHPEPGS